MDTPTDPQAKPKRTHVIKQRVDPDAAHAQAHGKTDAPLGTPDNPSNAIFTIPNVITFCRFVLVVLFLVFYINDRNRVLALTLYSIAAVTDFLDGSIARATQSVSWLGKIMDPVMDRVLLITGVLGLMINGDLPIWVAVFVIGRDVYLALGALRLQKYRHRPIDVIYVGKVATALLMSGFCFLLVGWPMLPGLGLVDTDWLPGLGNSAASLGIWLVYAGVVCSTIAAVIYTREGFFLKHERVAGREVETVESNRRARAAARPKKGSEVRAESMAAAESAVIAGTADSKVVTKMAARSAAKAKAAAASVDAEADA